jgi:hypothetical protein
MLTPARVTHVTPTRVRFRVVERRGDELWFARARTKLTAAGYAVETNALTGSVLVTGSGLDVPAIAAAAEEAGLFRTAGTPANEGQRLLLDVTRPIHALDTRIRRVTGGQVDLPLAVFLYLMGAAAWQLARGNLTAPPWYSGLWYAFGVYSRKLADRLPKDAFEDPSDGR